jgi:hypothetical protein
VEHRKAPRLGPEQPRTEDLSILQTDCHARSFFDTLGSAIGFNVNFILSSRSLAQLETAFLQANAGASTNVQDRYDNISVIKNTTTATIHQRSTPGYNRLNPARIGA